MKINPLNSQNNFISQLFTEKTRKNTGIALEKEILAGKINVIEEIDKWEANQKLHNRKQPKWNLNKLPLSYYIQDEPCENFNNEVKASFRNWETSSEGVISFKKSCFEENADICVAWTNDKLPGRRYEAGKNDLKVVNNTIEKAFIEIIISSEIDTELSEEAIRERVRRTALHEIGHALGLSHSNNPKDIMFHRGIGNKKLSNIDISRLVEHYKSNNLDFLT